jgi:DNA ligase-1
MSDTLNLFKFELPTLYARAETGNVLVWDIEVDSNKYRVTSGTENGGKVTSEFTTCQGKNIGKQNETTAEQQAQAEAVAKWKKKVKSGYWEDRNDIDKSAYFQPQLAHKWNDYKDNIDWSNGVYISPKLDGLRCITSEGGAFSRNGNEFVAFPHILRELENLFNKYPGLRLDGEIYTHKFKSDFNKIISLAKKTKPTSEDIAESEQHLEYWIYDCPSCPGGYHERYQFLHKIILENCFNNKWIKLCIHKIIKTPSELELNLTNYIENGFEGLMVNLYGGLYEQKRSKNLLKYKLFQDAEYKIVNITEGTGNRSGMLGYFTLALDNGKTFDSSARGNQDFYKRILIEKDELIGKMATVRFQALTPDGVPRFPVVISIRDYE